MDNSCGNTHFRFLRGNVILKSNVVKDLMGSSRGLGLNPEPPFPVLAEANSVSSPLLGCS